MALTGITWKTIKPSIELNDFVERFWMLANHTDQEHKVVVLPDGRFDIIFSFLSDQTAAITLKGLDIEPEQRVIPKKAIFFAVSFKPLAIEYLLDVKVNSLVNVGLSLPDTYWGITQEALRNFDRFSEQVSERLIAEIKPNIDFRKRQLFDIIYASNGTATVNDIAKRIFWQSRQINRYFNAQFGIPLKAYCNIIRFRSSLNHIKKGRLYPELSYADQNHFIREVKKMTGVTPKDLARNENDRFILLSAL